jgi:hypothetical protein
MPGAGPLIVIAALLAAQPAAAVPLETIEEIRACMRSNLPEHTSRQRVVLKARDRAGGVRVLEAQLHWKRFRRDLPRVRIRVDDPPDMRGASYLLIEQERGRESEMFVYLPAAQRVRRIAAKSMSDQLWGTDFSYDDMRQLQWIAAEGAHRRLEDREVAGRPTYVLALDLAPEEGSSYRRIVVFVDHDTCVNLRIEFYERDGEPRKVLSAEPESLFQQGERWLARELEMVDLRDQTTSWLSVVEVENDMEIPDRVFNPTFLDRGH